MNSILLGVLVCGYLLTFLLWTSYAFKQFKITNSKECASMESMFRILYEKKLTECIYECDVRPKCKVVNYRKRRLECDLLELPKGTPSFFVSNSDQTGPCVYIRRSNIYMNSSECCGNNCTIGQVCNTDEGKCIIKECHPFSVENAAIFGNMYQVGSRLKIKCNDGYAAVDDKIYTTCNTSGKWDPPVSCQTTDTNDCASNPCLPGGVCADGVNAYNCTFDFEFENVTYETNCTYEIHTNTVSKCTNPDIMTIWIYQNELSQPNATEACNRSIGGKLVKIDTQLKQECIRNILTHVRKKLDYWIDGSCVKAKHFSASDAWTFTDNTSVPMNQSVFWVKDTPNNRDIEHCVRMKAEQDYLWDNNKCSNTYGHICEIP